MSAGNFAHIRFFFSTRSIRSVGIFFCVNSFLFGNWVTRIPDVKAAIGLSEAELGLALLGAPIGSMLLMPIAGWLNDRIGLGRSLVISALFHILSPALLSLTSSFWTLFAAMGYFGLTNAWMDIAMNASAAIRERKLARPVMSSCHGMWSLGAMLGAASGSIALWIESAVPVHLSIVTVASIVFIILLVKDIIHLREVKVASDRLIAFPNFHLVLLSTIAFCVMISEGAMADWSALYMQETLHSPVLLVGLAYAVYSFLMASGRFMGDAIIPAIGKKRIVVFGGLISFFALGATLIIADPWFALIGFGLTGVGYSCVIPVIFSAAANEKGFSAGAGIASVTILAYTGFLLGPPLIGIVAEALSLTVALGVIVLLSGMVALIASLIRFK
ncbi:MAG: MFS family permease [Cyclobacteriaceae bacterium]|jgi:MFS family permease